MSWRTEFSSWMFPSDLETSDAPAVGSRAPLSSRLVLPATDGKPTIVSFLRHCGCPCIDTNEHIVSSITDTSSRGKDLSWPARHCRGAS